MGHKNEFELSIGGKKVQFTKSKSLGAFKYASWIPSTEVSTDIASPVGNSKIGSFFLREFPEPQMEDGVDGLRSNEELISISTHTYIISDDQVPYIPTGLINIRFRDQEKEKQELIKVMGKFNLEYVSSYIEGSHNVQVTKRSLNPMKVADKLQAMKDVIEIAEPELESRATLSSFQLPDDDWIKYQWHLKNKGRIQGAASSFVPKPGVDAGVIDAWEKFNTLGNPAITVAILDNGFDLTHPDLDSQDKVIAPWNFINETAFPNYPTHTENAVDTDGDGVNPGHGTACAGLAVGNANGSGKIVGVAPNCKLMPIRFTFNLGFFELNRQFQHALINGADVISCSWQPASPYHPINDCTKKLFKQMADSGIVICFAAGNSNKNINAADQSYFNGFANDESSISVSAINHRDLRYENSNWGEAIDVCAPAGTATADIVGRAGLHHSSYIKKFGQTSCSAAIVAGVCALVKSLNPKLSGYQVKEIISRSARKIDNQTNHLPWFGHGCVNALRAMNLTMSEFNGVV